MAVASHPNFGVGSYADTDAWIARLVETGVTRFRGLYDPTNAGCQRTVDLCRSNGLSWIMLVAADAPDVPTDQTPAQTAEIIRQIASECPDVCSAIEGLNEPDKNASGAPVKADWATAYAAPHQKAIWDTVRASPELSHVEVIGPSLHDVTTMASYRTADPVGGADHYEQLVRAGVGGWIDRVGLHHYPSGDLPFTGLQERLDLIAAAFGPSTKVHLTETGYTNALFQPTNTAGTYVAGEASRGNRPTSEAATATYLTQAFLKGAAIDLPTVWYELLDDPDPGPKSVTESNFGLWEVPETESSTWSAKPAATALKTLASTLSEADGPSYQPSPVRWQVSAPGDAEIFSLLTARRDGTVTAHLFRDVPVWDPVHRRSLPVSDMETTVTVRGKTRTVTVGAEVVSVDLSAD